MAEFLILMLSIAIGAILTMLSIALKSKKIKVKGTEIEVSKAIICIYALILFGVYMPHLFGGDYIMGFKLIQGSILHKEYRYGYIGDTQMIPLVLTIKWLSFLVFAFSVLTPFIERDEAKIFVGIFGVISTVLNLIFMKDILISIIGSNDYTNKRSILYFAILILVTGLSIYYIIDYVIKKDFKNIGIRILKSIGFGLIYAIAFMPIYLPQIVFGEIVDETKDFTLTHRILLYICFIYMFVSYFLLRNKPYKTRRWFLVALSLSGFLEYFAYASFRTGITQLPLHLCNTAIVLMFFTFIFKIESVFYFTYLVNVLGAFFAIIMPNTTGTLTNVDVIVYWYNHTYAATLPIMGVALGMFNRPNFKMIGKAIIAFSLYVLSASILDGWLNNDKVLNPYGLTIDYFFLYSNFFVEKVPQAATLKMVTWDLNINGQIVRLLPHYQGMIYIVFIALMFVVWGIYSSLFMVSDKHKELLRKRKLVRVDELELLKELNGRPKNSPLHPEGINMVKIENFGKTYAGSENKAVENINLEIHAGEVFGFIGHNGAGKSTTIKSLVGIQTITEGRIEVEGYDISRQPLEAKLNIGYVSDNHAVYEKLTGREYISYVADLYMVNEEDKKERLEKYAKMFNIEDALDREIKGYSHGMKQKIMVISTLIHEPKVWVLDEPLTGLDPTSSYQIKQCMREHANKGNIVFFSSHVIEVVEKICDRIAIISHGKIRKVATIDELKKEGVSLEELYLSYQEEK